MERAPPVTATRAGPMTGRARSPLPPSHERRAARWQRALGNRGVERLLQARLKPKLAVGAPDDQFERGADDPAGRMAVPTPHLSIGNRAVGRPSRARLEVALPGDRAGTDRVQVHSDGAGVKSGQQSAADETHVSQTDERPGPSPGHSDRLAWAENGVRGVGLPLPAGPRALLEAQFGSPFADVRLHTGPRAADAAQRLGAAAYTLGRDIAFGRGFYAPHTGGGLRLLAHELAHVGQSRGAPATPLSAGEAAPALGPLEQEAERASNAPGRHRAPVRQRLAGRMPLCHPVYISAHGKKDYLDLAAEFYTKWGYAPVHTGVPSIEAILRDLAGQSSIGQVTIVSHANPHLMQIQFVDGGPDQVEKSDWQVDTGAELATLERHLVPETMLDQVIANVQAAAPGALARIGAVSDPVVRQFLWWVVDEVYAEYRGFPAAQALRLKADVQAHTAVYRNRLLSPPTPPAGAGSGQPAVTATDLTVAEAAVRTQALRWQWPKPGSAPTQQLTQEQERRVKESPSAAVLRILQSPDFLNNLMLVRSRIGNASWIEVQGCNAGADPDYLKGIQSFFGGAARKPKVTAPDWFQLMGHYGFTPIREEDAPALWRTKEVQAALAYWHSIITGKPLPKKPTERTLLNYLRQGHALPLAVPAAPGRVRVLVLGTRAERAFLSWLSRHSYRLTSVADIKRALFTAKDFGANVEGAVVDMLSEHLHGPTKIVFRPSPEYAKHIIEVH